MQASGLAGQRVLSQVGTTGCRDAAADFLDVFEHRELVLSSPLQFSFGHEGLLWIRDPNCQQRPSVLEPYHWLCDLG